MLNKITEGKVRINCTEHSRVVQEALIKKGYKWRSQHGRGFDGEYIDYGKSFILFEEGNVIYCITYGESDEYREQQLAEFEQNKVEEVTLKEIIKYA